MPVAPVAANAVATSGWANSVSTSVNDIETKILAAGQLAIPWASITGAPATFPPTLAPAVAVTTFGQAKVDGVSTAGAHADHSHGSPALANAAAAITYGLAKVDGVSAAASHADHTHGTPPLPTPTQLAIGWADVTGKPTTFAPAAHKTSHQAGGADVIALPWADITGKPATFAPATHAASHASGGADVVAAAWASISGKPTSFTPSTHNSTHRYGDIDPVSAGNIGAVEARNTPSAVVTGTGRRLYVGTSTPTGMAEGDVWIKG